MGKKRFVGRILSVWFSICLALTFHADVFAENEWICSQCGAENSGNFCGNCGSARKDQWTCPNCQTVNTKDFCENCGREKPNIAEEVTGANLQDGTKEGYSTYINNASKYTINYPEGYLCWETSDVNVLITNDGDADFQISAGYTFTTETSNAIVYSAEDFADQIAEDETLVINWTKSQYTEITDVRQETLSGQNAWVYDYEMDDGSDYYKGSLYLVDGYGDFGCYYVLCTYNAYSDQAEIFRTQCREAAESFQVTGKYEDSAYQLYEIPGVHVKFLLSSDFEGEVQDEGDSFVIYPVREVREEASIEMCETDVAGGSYQETAQKVIDSVEEYGRDHYQKFTVGSAMTLNDVGRYSLYGATFAYITEDGTGLSQTVLVVPYEDRYYQISVKVTEENYAQTNESYIYLMYSLCMDDYGKEGDSSETEETSGSETEKESDGSDTIEPSFPADETKKEETVPVSEGADIDSLEISVGDIVTFGNYEQDNDAGNGKEPIEWIVLAEENGEALLISRYGLDCQPYNTEWTEVSWECCSLRSWLNGTFLNSAFSAEEQALIQRTSVSADSNPWYGLALGNAVTDPVFLLGVAEAEVYFPSDAARQCEATAYAAAQGAWTDGSGGNCWWWLRTPGLRSLSAAGILGDGSFSKGGDDVNFEDDAVRPALWVRLEELRTINRKICFDSGRKKLENFFESCEKEKLDQIEEETADSVKTAAADGTRFAVGDVVTFGNYEQDNDLSNGTEPIEWIVLAKEAGRALLVSRYALDSQPYHTEFVDVTWETSSLRKWLNETFLDAAFSAEEAALIMESAVTADRNPNYETSPGNAVWDRLFLLSINEEEIYFASDAARQCQPTAYAAARGVNGNCGSCWWWLRTPGYLGNINSMINSDGTESRYGNDVRYKDGAVRPAVWIRLQQ